MVPTLTVGRSWTASHLLSMEEPDSAILGSREGSALASTLLRNVNRNCCSGEK